MKHLFLGITAVIAVAVSGPVSAQGWPQVQAVAPASDPYRYRFVAPTPDDAYRQGLINRWELEQIEGPLPPAMQGPSPNGSRGGFPGSG